MLKDAPIPEIKDDELLVRVAYTGICGTDMHIVSDEYPAKMPVIMGHEFSGVVEKTGRDAAGFKPGDRVVSIAAGYTCGKCRYCREGLLMQCRERKSNGSGRDGAMAEYIAIKADRTFIIPENITIREAALTEPIACCVRSVIEISKIRTGDYVYVSGPGAIGQIVAQLAKLSGANVTMGGTTVDKERLALAKKLGADNIIDVMAEDVLAYSENLTHGGMYDVVYECAGAQASADTCLKLLRKRGQYVQVGLFGKRIQFDMDHALINEKHIVNSFGAERTSFITALRLIAFGSLKLDELISLELTLNEWESAFKAAFDKTGYKILLKP